MYIPLGERIMLIRKRRRLSKKELAEIIGVSPATISNYESGKTKPPVKKLLMISMALGVSINDFIDLLDSDFEAKYCEEKYCGQYLNDSLFFSGKLRME